MFLGLELVRKWDMLLDRDGKGDCECVRASGQGSLEGVYLQ